MNHLAKITFGQIGELMSSFDRDELFLSLGERSDQTIEIVSDIENVAERKTYKTSVDDRGWVRRRVDMLKDGYKADKCDHSDRERLKAEIKPLRGWQACVRSSYVIWKFQIIVHQEGVHLTECADYYEAF